MSLEIQFMGGNIPGDEDLSTAVTSVYYGGMPLMQASDGLHLCKSWNAAKLIGLARNARTVDAKTSRVAYIPLAAGTKIALKSDDGTAAQAPYDTTKTYALGEALYVNDAGKWTNDTTFILKGLSASSTTLTGQPARLRVMSPLPDSVDDPLYAQIVNG